MQEELRRELARFHTLTARMSSAALQDPTADLAPLMQSLSKLIDEQHPLRNIPDDVSVYSVIAALIFDLEVLGKSEGAHALLVRYRRSIPAVH